MGSQQTRHMTGDQALPSYADRLEQVTRRTSRAELEDLAGYESEITGWANELDTKIAGFAAEVEMYYDPETPRRDRAEIRARMLERAEETAAALRAIFQYVEPAVVPPPP
jgi:hypothetical protein